MPDISWAAHSGGSAPLASRHSAMGREGQTPPSAVKTQNAILHKLDSTHGAASKPVTAHKETPDKRFPSHIDNRTKEKG